MCRSAPVCHCMIICMSPDACAVLFIRIIILYNNPYICNPPWADLGVSIKNKHIGFITIFVSEFNVKLFCILIDFNYNFFL